MLSVWSAPSVFALIFLMGCSAMIALLHFLLWVGRRDEPLHIWICSWCLLTLGFNSGRLVQITGEDINTVVAGTRFATAAALLMLPLVAGISQALTGNRPVRWVVPGLSLGVVVLAVVTMTTDAMFTHDYVWSTDLTGQQYRLPDLGPLFFICFPASAAAFSYCFYTVYTASDFDPRERRLLLGAYVIYLVLGTNDLMLSAGVPPIHFWLFEFGFAGIAIALTRVTVHRFNALYHGLEAQVERRTAELQEKNVALDKAVYAAETATRTISAFLANVSHEVRTPMTAILGYADLLLDPAVPAHERETRLLTVRRNGEHLLGIINDILDLSKIVAGKFSVDMRPSSLVAVIQEATALLEGRATAKGLRLSADWRFPLPSVIETDQLRLHQIIVNLVGNAVKFTEGGGVTVRVSSPDATTVQIDVIDTGPGIAESDMDKIFQPFQQVDSSATRRFGGTGLGLAISHRLAGLLGGELTFKSRLGEGSTFTLRLPVGSVDARPLADLPGTAAADRRFSSLPSVTASGLRVLLAEDGDDNQELITLFLSRAGAAVEVVANGADAVAVAMEALARAEPHALVLMDMQMPIMDGYAATTELRKRGYRQPIVALTAHAMASDRLRCLEAGCDEYLAKPFSQLSLREILARFSYPAPTLPYRSLLGDDPDIRPLIRRFVDALPDRIRAMEAAILSGDLVTLGRLAHTLKGSSGSYGFPQLAGAAAELELALRQVGPPGEVAERLRRLRSVAAGARADTD